MTQRPNRAALWLLGTPLGLLILIVAFWSSDGSRRGSLEVPPPAADLLPGADEGAQPSDLQGSGLVEDNEGRRAPELPIEDPPSQGLEERQVEENGRLRMTVLDSVTREPLTQYVLNLALASAPQSKLLAVTPQNLHSLKVSPGAYIGVLFHPGYDLQSVDTFTVINEEATDLGVIYLERGSAGVAVRVLAPTALLARIQSIDLHATGRWPGYCCEGELETKEQPSSRGAHCPSCGYGATFSRRPYEAGELSWFENLPSGPLQLIVRSESDSILAFKRIELEPRELRQVTLEVSEKDVEVRLIDANDDPFDGLWFEGGEIFVAPIQFNIYSDGVVVAVTEIAPGMQLGEELDVGRFPAGTKPTRTPSNRPEASQDPLRPLWPKALTTPSGIHPSTARISRIRPGVFLMANVPASSNSALAACGPFADGSNTPFKIEGQKDVVTIKIENRCALSSRQFMSGPKFKECAGCHATPW